MKDSELVSVGTFIMSVMGTDLSNPRTAGICHLCPVLKVIHVTAAKQVREYQSLEKTFWRPSLMFGTALGLVYN